MVVVTFGEQRRSLRPGERLTVGRSPRSSIRLPDDDHLSRQAAVVQVVDDYVIVHNTSASKPLALRPPAGEDRVIEPGAATTALPFTTFGIVLAGRGGMPVTVAVDASGLGTAVAPADPAGPGRTAATVSRPIEFTQAQLRVLTELCRPMLTRSGPDARPAHYAEIAEALGLATGHVRNVIKEIRESLSGWGVPGLVGEFGPGHQVKDDFRLPLARWAIWSGWVDRRSLDGGNA